MLVKYHFVDFLACALLDNAEPVQKPLDLALRQADCLAFPFFRPFEAPVMKPLLIEPCPVIANFQDLDAVFVSSTEDEQALFVFLGAEGGGYLYRQRPDATSHVREARIKVDAGSFRKVDHSLFRISASPSGSILIFVPLAPI